MTPQLYHCFYCHMLYDGNGQGWGAYWNLTPTVAFLYMMRYWSGIVNFGRLIFIRALQCTGSDQRKMWYTLLLAVLSCFSEVGAYLRKNWGGGIFTRKKIIVNMPPLKSSQMYMTKPKQIQKKISENTGKTFSVIMPPFTSRGGHNYGNDCTKSIFFLHSLVYLGKPSRGKSDVFLNIVQTGGGGQPMFKNYVGNCRVCWRSFNNMKFAWKGTFEALMVKFGGEIGTLLLPFVMLKNAF